MKSRAAVVWEPNQPLQIEEITVDGPKEGEVLIQMKAASVCHIDALALHGNLNGVRYPTVLGHEGAGVVVEVGPGVKNLLVDDHVVPLMVPECGQCSQCRSGKTNLCNALQQTQALGLMPDGSSRFSQQGSPLYHFLGTSTLSEYTVVPEVALARVNHKASLESVCLLGCTLTSGIGAVSNIAQMPPGATVAVFGLGGLGLSVVQGAVMSQAARIIGIDTNINKFPLAEQFGATDCLNPRDHVDPIESIIQDMTGGGVDFAFECIGVAETMESALACTHPGWGKAIVLGVADTADKMTIQPGLLSQGRQLQGAQLGGIKGRTQLPELAEQYISKELLIDPLITHRLTLEDVNLAFDLLHSGESIRSVITF